MGRGSLASVCRAISAAGSAPSARSATTTRRSAGRSPGTTARAAAARAVVPGLRPADLLVVVALLAEGADPAAEIARQTLAKLPRPILNGALSAELEPFVLHKLVPSYLANA